MFFVLLPQRSLIRDAGHSVHSSPSVVEMNCPPHIIKELSNFANILTTEFVLELCIQTLHVLVVESEFIQFSATF